MTTNSNSLQKQVEMQRFLHGIDYVHQSAGGLKILSTSELAHLNQLLTASQEDPWRLQPASITLRTGHTHHFNVINNPIPMARDVISYAQKLAHGGDLKEGAFHLYSQLVLHHLFNDANRRTAALATLWLVQAEGASMDALALEGFVIGDLRDPAELARLIHQFQALIK